MSEPPAKPRVEVVEETAEALDVIDLDRTPRPEKWARESRHLASGHEAAFSERAFRPRRPETIDEIRAAVDALAPARRALPEPAPQEPPAPLPREVPARLRLPIEAATGATVEVATVVSEQETAEIVEATLATPDGDRRLETFVVADGVARPVDALASKVDELPPPRLAEDRPAPPAPVEAPSPAAPLPRAPADEPLAKKSLLGRFRKEPSPEAAAPAPTPQPEEPAAPKKSLLGRFRKDAAPEPQPAPDAPASEPAPQEPAKKGLLGRFRKGG